METIITQFLSFPPLKPGSGIVEDVAQVLWRPEIGVCGLYNFQEFIKKNKGCTYILWLKNEK